MGVKANLIVLSLFATLLFSSFAVAIGNIPAKKIGAGAYSVTDGALATIFNDGNRLEGSTFCGVTPITNSIRQRIGNNVVIKQIINIQDQNNRYFIVVDGQDKWYIYDVGNDGLIDTVDDNFYLGEKIDKVIYGGGALIEVRTMFVTSTDYYSNERLFWTRVETKPGYVTIKSCTLNKGCDDIKEEVSLLENETDRLLTILPITSINKNQNPILYLQFFEARSYTYYIASCNLYGNDNKSCKKINLFSDLTKITNISEPLNSLKDTGMVNNYGVSLFYPTTGKIVQLSEYKGYISPLIGSGTILGVRQVYGPEVIIELDAVSVFNESKINTLDKVVWGYLDYLKLVNPIILDFKGNRIIIIYRDRYFKNIYAKVAGGNSGKLIFNDYGIYDSIENMIYLSGGQFIAEGEFENDPSVLKDIVLFDCMI